MTSFSVQSFGCRVNQAEAFDWVGALQRHGLVYRNDSSGADLVLVNTCTITSRADRDVRHFMSRMARVNPEARLVLTGCYAERFFEELKNSPQVWRVFHNDEKKELPGRLLATLGSEPNPAVKAKPFRSRALVKIQDGCNFRCSFCIIPQLRGKSASLPPNQILDRARACAKQGYEEIVLTGIHLCSYGRDLPEKSSLVDLLGRLEGMRGLGRVRLSSLDPRFLDSKLREAITQSPIVCPHFHLSLQHGSDDVIHRMGRKITSADYRRILNDVHKKKPEAALGADLIVGFPGETEEDFQRMVDFLEDAPLTYLHVFSYSARPGTPAFRWKQIDEKVKKERAARLRALSCRKNMDFRKKWIGVVWDGVVVKRVEGKAFVLTSNFIEVQVPARSAEIRKRVRVKIVDAQEKITRGEIVELPR